MPSVSALKQAFVEEGVGHFASGWVWIVTGSDGIRPTMASWGEFLLAEFQTTRLRDPTLDMLGVFTDNGAFYDAGAAGGGGARAAAAAGGRGLLAGPPNQRRACGQQHLQRPSFVRSSLTGVESMRG